MKAPTRFPIELTQDVAIGRQPVEREIAELGEKGYKTLINIRGTQEINQPMSPVEEGKLVERAGLSYVHHPVTVADIDDRLVDRFMEILTAVDKPVLIHCENGLRAALLALIFVGCEEKHGGDWTLEKAEELGFELCAPLLRTFARAYVDRHLRITGFVRRSA
jgi:uncharacterized protein (TIGR01244 family)